MLNFVERVPAVPPPLSLPLTTWHFVRRFFLRPIYHLSQAAEMRDPDLFRPSRPIYNLFQAEEKRDDNLEWAAPHGKLYIAKRDKDAVSPRHGWWSVLEYVGSGCGARKGRRMR